MQVFLIVETILQRTGVNRKSQKFWGWRKH